MAKARVKRKGDRVVLDFAKGVTITARRPSKTQESKRLQFQRAKSIMLANRVRSLENLLASSILTSIGTSPTSSPTNSFRVQEKLTTARITAANKEALVAQNAQLVARLKELERQSTTLKQTAQKLAEQLESDRRSLSAQLQRAFQGAQTPAQRTALVQKAAKLRSMFDARISELRTRFRGKSSQVYEEWAQLRNTLETKRADLQRAVQASQEIPLLQRELRQNAVMSGPRTPSRRRKSRRKGSRS